MFISYLIPVAFFIIFLHLPLAFGLPLSYPNSLNNDLSTYSTRPSDTNPPIPPARFFKHLSHLKSPPKPKSDNILTLHLGNPDRDADLYHSITLFSSHSGWRSRNPFSGGTNFMAGFNNLFGGGCSPADTILRIQGVSYARANCNGGTTGAGALPGRGGGFAEGAGGALGRVDGSSWNESDHTWTGDRETTILRTGIMGQQAFTPPCNPSVGHTSACIRLEGQGAESIVLLRHLSTVPRTQAAMWENDDCEGEPDQWAGMLIGQLGSCTQARKSGSKRARWRSMRVWYGSERLGIESWGEGRVSVPRQGAMDKMQLKKLGVKRKREIVDMSLTNCTTIDIWHTKDEKVFSSRFWATIVGLARKLSFHTTKSAEAVKTVMQRRDTMDVPATELSSTDEKWVNMKVREWRMEHNKLEPETNKEIESLTRKLEG